MEHSPYKPILVQLFGVQEETLETEEAEEK
jgi:hypothetical protein